MFREEVSYVRSRQWWLIPHSNSFGDGEPRPRHLFHFYQRHLSVYTSSRAHDLFPRTPVGGHQADVEVFRANSVVRLALRCTM